MADVRYIIDSPVRRAALRIAMRAVFALMRVRWFITRPRTHGVSAFCFTVDGRLILVWSTYEQGWNLPSGGRHANESPLAAILRELREEIGLLSFDTIAPLATMEHHPNFKRDAEQIFHLTGVCFAAPQGVEIERIGLFAPNALPLDTSLELRHRLTLCRSAISLQATG